MRGGPVAAPRLAAVAPDRLVRRCCRQFGDMSGKTSIEAGLSPRLGPWVHPGFARRVLVRHASNEPYLPVRHPDPAQARAVHVRARPGGPYAIETTAIETTQVPPRQQQWRRGPIRALACPWAVSGSRGGADDRHRGNGSLLQRTGDGDGPRPDFAGYDKRHCEALEPVPRRMRADERLARHALAAEVREIRRGALAAFAPGARQFLLPKGRCRHRALGFVWVALMLDLAGNSLFVRELRLRGRWSPIHLLGARAYPARGIGEPLQALIQPAIPPEPR